MAKSKQLIRKEIREKTRSLISESALVTISRNLAQLLDREFPSDLQIGAFRATKDEAGMELVLSQKIATTKNFSWSFPRVVSETEMHFHQCKIPLEEADFVLSKWNIREPLSHLPRRENLDIILIPLVAFNSKGFRLGQGKGFYDRFLAHSKAVKVGIGFSWQESDELPVEPHDISLNMICTEKEIRHF